MTAGKVLNSYPDYTKSPPSYSAGIIEAISQYDQETQNHLADIRVGVRAKCEYLPTVAAVIKCAEEFLETRQRAIEIGRRYDGIVRAEYEPSPAVFNPFPQLSKLFQDEPELLMRPFGILQDAFFALLKSKEEARVILKNKIERPI